MSTPTDTWCCWCDAHHPGGTASHSVGSALPALAAAYLAQPAGRALAARLSYRSLLELSNLLSDACGDLHNVLITDALTDADGNLTADAASMPRAVAHTAALGELGLIAVLVDTIRARLGAP